MTSIGVTTSSDSVAPAARPDIKMPGDDVLPSLPASDCLKYSNDENLIAIFGTIPDTTAPRPLYRDRTPSFCAIWYPTAIKLLLRGTGLNEKICTLDAVVVVLEPTVVIDGTLRTDAPRSCSLT
jgi:hypothetical protein